MVHFQSYHRSIFVVHGPASPFMFGEKLLEVSSGPHFLRGDLISTSKGT